MLPTADLDYDLPPELVATAPASPRDSARLLVIPRRADAPLQDASIRDLPRLLTPGDLLAFNVSRVLPARLLGVREGTGGHMEALYLHQASPSSSDLSAPRPSGPPDQSRLWIVLVRARHVRPGACFRLLDRAGSPSPWRLVVRARAPDEPGAWLAQVEGPEGRFAPLDVLECVGRPPLPPYIRRARRQAGLPVESPADATDYQTLYAREAGSVAAPTAGLHFTPALLDALAAAGIARTDVVLHVGAGTFRPVETEYVEQHPMHAEWCSMSSRAVEAVRHTRDCGRRVIAVGTTACRTLESYAVTLQANPAVIPPAIETRLLITPGYRFLWTDALVTNFHLPRSTLMALVAALLGDDGVARLKHAYRHAVARRYRFYSFGDACLIL